MQSSYHDELCSRKEFSPGMRKMIHRLVDQLASESDVFVSALRFWVTLAMQFGRRKVPKK